MKHTTGQALDAAPPPPTLTSVLVPAVIALGLVWLFLQVPKSIR